MKHLAVRQLWIQEKVPRGQGRSLVDFPRSEFGRCFDSPVHGSADETSTFPESEWRCGLSLTDQPEGGC